MRRGQRFANLDFDYRGFAFVTCPEKAAAGYCGSQFFSHVVTKL